MYTYSFLTCPSPLKTDQPPSIHLFYYCTLISSLPVLSYLSFCLKNITSILLFVHLTTAQLSFPYLLFPYLSYVIPTWLSLLLSFLHFLVRVFPSLPIFSLSSLLKPSSSAFSSHPFPIFFLTLFSCLLSFLHFLVHISPHFWPFSSYLLFSSPIQLSSLPIPSLCSSQSCSVYSYSSFTFLYMSFNLCPFSPDLLSSSTITLYMSCSNSSHSPIIFSSYALFNYSLFIFPASISLANIFPHSPHLVPPPILPQPPPNNPKLD